MERIRLSYWLITIKSTNLVLLNRGTWNQFAHKLPLGMWDITTGKKKGNRTYRSIELEIKWMMMMMMKRCQRL
ncbi:hypothetical protein BLOT_013378 [Blomia tropicalis]|nr:hypothetical protein BLOT_013378 [Blomia tropicalis]